MKKLFDDQLIIVTGGAGFIGSGVVRHLNDKGIKNIVIIDDLGNTEKWKNLVGKSFADIIPIKDTFTWLEGKESFINAFIHLGACTSTVETDATYLLENNYRYSKNLAEYALSNNHRFIYASSAATYGDGAQGFTDNEDELETLRPQNMYGYSKQLFDLWLKNQGLLNKVVGIKYFNVYGPNEKHKGRMASAIIKMLQSAQQDGSVRLFKSNDPANFTDGGQKRDFIYVKDAVRMTCSFLDNDAGGIYNIGTGTPNTWNDLAKGVFKAINKPVNIEYIPIPADIIGYQNYTAADMKKTQAVLKDAAKCPPLENSVVEYVRDYLIPQQTW